MYLYRYTYHRDGRDGGELWRGTLGRVRRGGDERGARGELRPLGQPEMHELQTHVVEHRVRLRLSEAEQRSELGPGGGSRGGGGGGGGGGGRQALDLRHHLPAARSRAPDGPLARPLAAQRPPLERAVQQPHAALSRRTYTQRGMRSVHERIIEKSNIKRHKGHFKYSIGKIESTPYFYDYAFKSTSFRTKELSKKE